MSHGYLSKAISRLRNKVSDKPDEDIQSGINMVDLMMWLVIAALLLATALQGIAYYQKAAWLYQVKNDVMGGATKVISVSGIEHLGKVDEAIIDEGLTHTDITKDVVLESDTSDDGSPLIRGTHPGIPDKEVLYFFKSSGTYLSHEVYIVDAVSPDAGSGSGSEATLYPGGDIDGDGVPNSSDPDIDGDGTLNESDDSPNGTGGAEDISSPGTGDGTTAVTVGTVSDDGSLSFVDPKTDHDHHHEPISPNQTQPGQQELTGWVYDPAYPHRVGITAWTDGVKRGVGGNQVFAGHIDSECVNPGVPGVITHKSTTILISLEEDYPAANLYPGPNSNTVTTSTCVSGEIMLSTVFRPFRESDWNAVPSMTRPAYWTRDIVEAWYSPNRATYVNN